ncbi:hypothetical protein FJZ33_09110 [Candidatus Poribacteria bacterium]|nr:hypothetical protein [Candidatus Poribacteria bacterium]
METLRILTEDMEETANLLKEALDKEKYILQIGIDKTKARIQRFEQQYSATLAQILDQKQKIDHGDLSEWEGEIEILQRLMKKAKNLEKIEICV